ncbi:MAG: MBL fold metallo-hydrolase [Polyangiales bacterium]
MDAPHTERVARGVRRLALRTPTLPPATRTNCYLVGERDFVVVEPASPWEPEQALLDAVIEARLAEGHRVVAAVVTHHHRDHVGGAAALRARHGAPILAHPYTRHRVVAEGLAVDGVIEPGAALPGPLVELGVEAMHTPGHAAGHLCLWSPGDGWKIAGDMVASVGTIIVDPDDGGDMVDYLASLASMRAVSPGRLLPAHGDPIDDAVEKIDGYVRHREGREEKVRAALTDAWREVGEVVSLAYDDTPRALWPLATKSARAHLARLESRGLARSAGEGATRRWSRADGTRDDG